jgi:ribonuclease Z
MSFRLTILGSGSALPTSNRNLTAHVLNVDERFFLIDCGEGTQLQLRKFKAKLGRLNHILISHLHGDHVFGLPGLISTFNLLGRTQPLHVYAHPDLEKILAQFLSYFFVKMEFPIVYHNLTYNEITQIYEDEKIAIFSFPLIHRVPTCGFLFREKPKLRNIRKDMIEYYKIPIKDIVGIKQGEDFITDEGIQIPNDMLTMEPTPQKSYAFCSDTAYSDKIIPWIHGVDVLYHEATFSAEDTERAKETKHSTAADAATIALKANAKKLILGHFSARYKDENQLIEEAKKIFPGTIAAEDGLEIVI